MNVYLNESVSANVRTYGSPSIQRCKILISSNNYHLKKKKVKDNVSHFVK